MDTYKLKRILELYDQRWSFADIGKEVELAHGTVYNWIKKSGHPMRTASQSCKKYDIDDYLFSNIDSSAKAHFLGWIWSDGCLHKGSISLKLSALDTCVLEYFNKFLYDNKRPLIYEKGRIMKTRDKDNVYYHTNDQVGITIRNKQIANDLMKLGLHERKSHTIEYPKFSGFECDFIRGVFEGDGSISFGVKKKRKRLGTYIMFAIFGSKSLMTSIQKILHQNHIETQLYLSKRSNIYSLETQSPEEVLKFYHFIYDGNSPFVLQRKVDVFKRIEVWYQKWQSYRQAGFDGTWFDPKIQLWRLTFNGAFVGYYNNIEEAMDERLKLLKAKEDKLVVQSII
jgi:hypothetical protein